MRYLMILSVLFLGLSFVQPTLAHASQPADVGGYFEGTPIGWLNDRICSAIMWLISDSPTPAPVPPVHQNIRNRAPIHCPQPMAPPRQKAASSTTSGVTDDDINNILYSLSDDELNELLELANTSE